MKYDTVTLTPRDNAWEVSFKKNPLERIRTKTIPNDRGFYHYPETMSKKAAARKLIQRMIVRHKEEISKLTDSLNALRLIRDKEYFI